MRRFFCFVALLFSGLAALAQQARPANLPPQKELFKYFQGYAQDYTTFYFEGEGYQMAIKYSFGEARPEAYQKVLKKIAKNADIIHEELNGNPVNNYVALETNDKKEVVKQQIVYFFPYRKDIVTVAIGHLGSLDTAFTNQLAASVFYDSICSAKLIDPHARNLDFEGRSIPLPPHYQWMGACNLQTSVYGQVNWSEYRNMEDAVKNKELQKAGNEEIRMMKILSEEKVPVVFEGKEVVADKVEYKAKVPKFMAGGSNVLIVYYVAAEVRGKYIHCVMSYFDNQAPVYDVAPLIKQIMSLK